MTVYFLRHGSAERESSGGDRARKLTAQGQKEVRGVAARALRAGVRPDLVIASPYLRARETALLAAKELDADLPFVHSDALVPEASPQQLWDEVRVHGADSVFVVSHEPLLSSTIAWVLGSARDLVLVPPAGLIAIDFSSRGPTPVGVLRWMITPELCSSGLLT